jgi:hypothetical protein
MAKNRPICKKMMQGGRKWTKKRREEESGNSSTDRFECYFWLWTRLPNLYTAWMSPLVREMYSGLTQSVFRLDIVKSISCDCPAKIPVDVCSNASCFTCFSSGSSSPEVAEFCPTLRLVYFITCALSSVYSLPCDNFVQKVVSQVKKLFFTALRTCTRPGFFLRKK